MLNADTQQFLVLLAALILLEAGKLGIQVFGLKTLQKMQRMFFKGPQPQAPELAQNFEIQKEVNGKWMHVGFRHENHPDLEEAKNTPGLRVVVR